MFWTLLSLDSTFIGMFNDNEIIYNDVFMVTVKYLCKLILKLSDGAVTLLQIVWYEVDI